MTATYIIHPIPPAIHIDAAAAYDSQARIRALADTIIPVHEPACAKVPTIPA
ncbi:MAG: hypothetical protein SVV67_05120 [Bacillota bacterium]|nr:hypothetical protein [Bacillota bacterium]